MSFSDKFVGSNSIFNHGASKLADEYRDKLLTA
jgi:hypothetical protein